MYLHYAYIIKEALCQKCILAFSKKEFSSTEDLYYFIYLFKKQNIYHTELEQIWCKDSYLKRDNVLCLPIVVVVYVKSQSVLSQARMVVKKWKNISPSRFSVHFWHLAGTIWSTWICGRGWSENKALCFHPQNSLLNFFRADLYNIFIFQ